MEGITGNTAGGADFTIETLQGADAGGGGGEGELRRRKRRKRRKRRRRRRSRRWVFNAWVTERYIYKKMTS